MQVKEVQYAILAECGKKRPNRDAGGHPRCGKARDQLPSQARDEQHAQKDGRKHQCRANVILQDNQRKRNGEVQQHGQKIAQFHNRAIVTRDLPGQRDDDGELADLDGWKERLPPIHENHALTFPRPAVWNSTSTSSTSAAP